MMQDLGNWRGCARPPHQMLEGGFVRLEPLNADKHGAGLFAASNVADKKEKFRWLFESPPQDEASYIDWVRGEAAKTDPLYYAVIDLSSGKVAGRQALMRIDAGNGAIEIGSIYWGPLVAGQRGATEALYLFMKHAFEDLGYRRFEWKCNNDNAPSKRAAKRFGFSYEGLFRQHMVIKGENRDTAWFSIIDSEWPALKADYEQWLAPENFDANGQQKQRLGVFLGKG